MKESSAIQRYDSVARALHWASALLIVVAFIMGLMVDVPVREWRPAWLNVHVLIGLTILLIAIVRLAWRMSHPAPPLVAGTTPRLALAAHLGHGALYLAMLAVPLIGFAPLFTRGRGINFGLFVIPSPIASVKAWVEPTTEIHQFAAYALIALAVGHVAAALWHQFVQKDRLLLRMMPARKADGT